MYFHHRSNKSTDTIILPYEAMKWFVCSVHITEKVISGNQGFGFREVSGSSISFPHGSLGHISTTATIS
jgi:hypothetical protein